MARPSLQQQVTFLRSDRLEETAVFYQTVLGLKLALDQGKCKIFQVNTAAFIGFCEHIEGVSTDGVILTLVSDEVDEWYNYLVAQHVSIEKPPTLNESFKIYHLFLRDPNGYLVEIQRFLDQAWPKIQNED